MHKLKESVITAAVQDSSNRQMQQEKFMAGNVRVFETSPPTKAPFHTQKSSEKELWDQNYLIEFKGVGWDNTHQTFLLN